MSNQRRADSLVTGVVLFRYSTGMPCPYLPGRVERQVYTELSEPTSREVFRRLSAAGFRRSHHITYRPACPGCSACVPGRVPVSGMPTSR
jgi:arginine-tRNA-protein transferase